MSEELKPNRFDGMWGREIRANAERERMKSKSPTPRPWRWLPDEGQFIVAADDYIVAEIPCQGSNPADGAFIVEVANSHDSLKSELSRLREALETQREHFCYWLLRAYQSEPEVWDKVKRKAAEQGITIRDVVFSLLAAWLLEENI